MANATIRGDGPPDGGLTVDCPTHAARTEAPGPKPTDTRGEPRRTQALTSTDCRAPRKLESERQKDSDKEKQKESSLQSSPIGPPPKIPRKQNKNSNSEI